MTMFIKKVYYHIKNKFVRYNYAFKISRQAKLKLVNPDIFFQMKDKRFHEPQILEFKNGFKLKCQYEDLSAVAETCILEDYAPEPDFIPKAGQIIFDVGANIGDFAIYAASFGAKVFAVEPEPRNVARLEENIKLNNFEDKVKIIPCALFYKDQQVGFSVSHSSPGGHAINSGENEVKVQAKTFNTILREESLDSIDLLKVDIEGGEYEIFSHPESCSFEKIKRIVGEYHVSFNKAERFLTLKRNLKPYYSVVKSYFPYYFYAKK